MAEGVALIELPPSAPLVPSATTHTLLTDLIIYRWYDVHGCSRSRDLALSLGGSECGYTEEWVLCRYLYLVDQTSGCLDADTTAAPPLLVHAHIIDDAHDTASEAPTERAQTPEKEIKTSGFSRAFVPMAGRRTWGPNDDRVLLESVETYGQNWRAVARHMGGRQIGYSDDAVRNRYMRLMNLRKTPYRYMQCTTRKGNRWSAVEDKLITELFAELVDTEHCRCPWGQIVERLGTNRTFSAVRLRAQRLGLIEYRSRKLTQTCP